jgi:hypothetical protein
MPKSKRGVRDTNFPYRPRLAATTATVLAGLLSLALEQPASANPVTQGGSSVAPDHYTASPGTPLTSEGFSFTTPMFSYTAYIYTATSANAATGAGECVGCLNYVVTLEVDSGADISKVDLSNFAAGNPLDAGYNTELGTGMAGDPTSVAELSNGTVEFTFSPAMGSSGQVSSQFLEVETDTTTHMPGNVCSSNSTTTKCGAGYEPSPAPPIGVGLPAVLGVGGLLFGASLLERSKKRRSPGTAIAQAAA